MQVLDPLPKRAEPYLPPNLNSDTRPHLDYYAVVFGVVRIAAIHNRGVSFCVFEDDRLAQMVHSGRVQAFSSILEVPSIVICGHATKTKFCHVLPMQYVRQSVLHFGVSV